MLDVVVGLRERGELFNEAALEATLRARGERRDCRDEGNQA